MSVAGEPLTNNASHAQACAGLPPARQLASAVGIGARLHGYAIPGLREGEARDQMAIKSPRVAFTGLDPTAMLAEVTERLEFLVASRPGLISPTTLAAQMAATFQRHSKGRLLLNVVTGGESAGQRASRGRWQHPAPGSADQIPNVTPFAPASGVPAGQAVAA